MERQTRVRFAPSPTGPLHMGGVRTALYNYLFAKQNKSKFILRIEDTDSQRFVPGAEEYILESLAWCGIVPDEGIEVVESGNTENIPANKKITYRIASEKSEKNPHAPYRQSERKPLYRQYAEQLVENGYAYYAFDSAEELSKLRAEAEANKQTFIYNYQSRKTLKNSLTLPAEEVKKLIQTTDTWTIRFKIPEGQTVKMNDLIRGDMEVETNTLDDKVLWKAADQLPTYHLANIVDDHLMEITEVIRGAEWLPSLPLHYLLYKAFGWEDTMPRFAHLSLLLKPDGKGKLSKRDGDRLGFPVFPLKWTNPETGEISRGYREDGYYPEAFVNLLALLGWNPGTEQELFTLEELVPVFSLERVIKSGAKFNVDKAKWFNEQYLRRRTPEQLAREFRPMLSDALNRGNGLSYVTSVMRYVNEHASERQDAITSLFLTNHDQDRWAEWVGKSLAKEKQSAAMLLTSPGKPFIYMGEELGYTGKRTGDTDVPRRMPMAWDASLSMLCNRGLDDAHQSDNTDYSVVKGSISVETQEADAGSLLNVYKTWSRLRNTYPALAAGTMSEHATLNGRNTGAQSIAAWYMWNWKTVPA